jgi:O-antigen/teichoic acid export membrane protein
VIGGTRSEAVLGTLRLASVRQGGVFLASRVLNGALALVQVWLVTQAVGPAEAGRFFVLWTAAWLLSVVIKFGADGVLPRAVAEARLSGSERVSVRRVEVAGVAAGVVLAPAAMALLEIPFGPLEMALLAGLALSWAANGILAALLKAHGRADLSGLVANLLWPLGGAIAPLVVLVTGGDWLTIAELTLVASFGSLAAGMAVALSGLKKAVVAGLVADRDWVIPVGRDEVGAAVLTTLYEVIVWLPVLLG